jgi:acetoin utilization deacetylase AcuC-like enzyme
MTILYTDPIFLEHKTGRHPERPERLGAITKRLDEKGLAKRCTPGKYKPLDEDVVRALHDARMVQMVKQLAEHGGGRVDPDTVVSPESFKVALAAAGACVSAVDAVLQGTDKIGLCLVRPPGHHATPNRSMGFCLFNSIALACYHARKVHKVNRVLIIDWDVHHGNGTQDIFYEDGEVFFFSAHRYGMGFYPGTGDATETGKGEGLGWTLNLPLRFGITSKEYRPAFQAALEKAAEKCRPELVLISAGFDAHAEDPVGSLGLEVEDFAHLTRSVLDVARTHAKGRVVSCLEGGYNVDRLAESVEAHLKELLEAKE